ncbi:DUF1049 domain-containing protein [Mycobacterium sp. M1]|uniref:DUF1049 domain-containing protein n=2 Tax=Mycolicibacter acidiphilus TaxID=2835306 RepID=A0ABS5RN85_9MYCO|nr:lipopolysaccharide assembly protein LapA domain-containing protein [Mycolicibacter acidiphilus]MBS9535770.1 DUF1049 domain-containing protein [Mycolicibacter acidiphilus]
MSSDQPVPAEPMHDGPGASPPAPEMKFTRAGALWAALVAGFFALIVLLIFVTQNGNTLVSVHFLAWTTPQLQLGVVILLAAVGGGLLTVLVGTVRIFQLRRAAKKALAAHHR